MEQEISADVVVRYLSLIRYLEDNNGYGNYVITMHGKRPVKIARVQKQRSLNSWIDIREHGTDSGL